MSNRTERRAAERAARKLAFKELRQGISQQLAPVPVEAPVEAVIAECAATQAPVKQPAPPISEAQLAANRANALLSTGPATPEGRAISSLNALTHGLTGKTVVLPSEDAAEYDRKLNAYTKDLKPATEEEHRLVQTLLDSFWRIDRIKRLETGLILKGQLEFANKFQDQSPADQASLINVEGYLKYEKSICNLHRQEARLIRQLERAQAELLRLQTVRKREDRAAADAAVKPHGRPRANADTPNGFDFSTSKTQPASFRTGAPTPMELPLRPTGKE
jgi:hypothetical protein